MAPQPGIYSTATSQGSQLPAQSGSGMNFSMPTGSYASTGAMIGSLFGPGVGTAIGAGIGGLADIVGAIVNYQETQSAKEESRKMYDDSMAMQREKNRFDENIATQNLALTKRAEMTSENRFQQDKFQTNLGITKSAFNDLMGILDKNVGLKNSLLQTWAG